VKNNWQPEIDNSKRDNQQRHLVDKVDKIIEHLVGSFRAFGATSLFYLVCGGAICFGIGSA
jgi:hypothetical protein